jgi:hypothetical protein
MQTTPTVLLKKCNCMCQHTDSTEKVTDWRIGWGLKQFSYVRLCRTLQATFCERNNKHILWDVQTTVKNEGGEYILLIVSMHFFCSIYVSVVRNSGCCGIMNSSWILHSGACSPKWTFYVWDCGLQLQLPSLRSICTKMKTSLCTKMKPSRLIPILISILL